VRCADLTGNPEQESGCHGSENQPSAAAQFDIDDRRPEKQQDGGNLQDGVDARDLPDGETSLAEQERQSCPDESDVDAERQDQQAKEPGPGPLARVTHLGARIPPEEQLKKFRSDNSATLKGGIQPLMNPLA
jgi:hypothetical protein